MEKYRTCNKCYRYNSNENTKKRYSERRALLQKLKNVPCADCGGVFPTYVMDFDHRNREEKLFNVARRLHGKLDTLLDEIAKCDVVCANCHRIRTYGEKYGL